MKSRQIDLARRNQKIAVDQIDDAVGQIGREVRAVVGAAVLAQPARDVDPRPALAQRQLHIGISLVVAQQDVEARLALLDQIIFERQRLFVVGDHDVVDIDGLAHQRAGLGVFPAAFVEVAGHPAAQVLRLADVDDVAFGVLVEIHAGLGRNGADFGLQVHGARDLPFYWMETGRAVLQKRQMSLVSLLSPRGRRSLSLSPAFLLGVLFLFGHVTLATQTAAQASSSQSAQPQITKSPKGKQEEAARARRVPRRAISIAC